MKPEVTPLGLSPSGGWGQMSPLRKELLGEAGLSDRPGYQSPVIAQGL